MNRDKHSLSPCSKGITEIYFLPFYSVPACILTLFEMDAYQLSSHFGLDRNRGIGLNIPDGTELYGYSFLDCYAYSNRDRGRYRFF